ncbi:MAG: helix-turn-helix transcriptional regulator [Negativicutes bacterium]|jgi:ribosome-binding protein aMBF1 (putative translation factor)
MSKNKISPIGESWDVFEKKIFTPEEIAASDLRVALVGEIINARQAKGMTQKQIEEASGVKQPVIARLERGTTDPQLSTVMKVLASLGKTLVIAPLQNNVQARKSKTA